MHLLPADLRREHPRGQRTWHGHSLARCQLLQASERLLLPCCSLRMLMRCACTALHASTLVDFRSCSFSGRVRCRLALPLVCRRTARGATSCSWTGPYTTREMKQVLDTPPHGEPLDGRRGVQAPGASEHRSSSQVGTLAGAHSLSSRQRQGRQERRRRRWVGRRPRRARRPLPRPRHNRGRHQMSRSTKASEPQHMHGRREPLPTIAPECEAPGRAVRPGEI